MTRCKETPPAQADSALVVVHPLSWGLTLRYMLLEQAREGQGFVMISDLDENKGSRIQDHDPEGGDPSGVSRGCFVYKIQVNNTAS